MNLNQQIFTEKNFNLEVFARELDSRGRCFRIPQLYTNEMPFIKY